MVCGVWVPLGVSTFCGKNLSIGCAPDSFFPVNAYLICSARQSRYGDRHYLDEDVFAQLHWRQGGPVQLPLSVDRLLAGTGHASWEAKYRSRVTDESEVHVFHETDPWRWEELNGHPSLVEYIVNFDSGQKFSRLGCPNVITRYHIDDSVG